MNAIFSRAITSLITNPALHSMRLGLYGAKRILTRTPPTVYYFHQLDDPYSHLSASLIPVLQHRYKVDIQSYLVDQPSQQSTPDRERLKGWAARDAIELAKKFDITPIDNFSAPPGTALLKRLGHYSGAMFYFEGEWYWGIDRLHYLEKRLHHLNLANDANLPPLVSPPRLLFKDLPLPTTKPVIHFFCSLRSPYTWLALPRIFQLTEHYQAELKLRFVLPMVMRGLPVPIEKRLYILRDTKREAVQLDMPFGCVADPVGTPTQQGLAVLHHAIAQGKGKEFLYSFLQGVFAEGIDAGSMKGLNHIAARAGISTVEVKKSLEDDSWQKVAEHNRSELLTQGLWGVPSFYVEGYPALWGQDRLWRLEQDLIHSINE